MKYIFFSLILCLGCAHAFELTKQKTTYLDRPNLTLGIGFGSTQLVAGGDDIKGKHGISFRVMAGHHLSKNLIAEVFYQVSGFRFYSPDPVSGAEPLLTRAGISEQVIRASYVFDKKRFQPYISAGIGGYHFFGEDAQTALAFPFSFEVPVSVGLRSFYAKDRFSFDIEFMYRFLLGENQEQDVLNLLNVDEISFNAISIMGIFTFHTF
ncbi:MAG TPA: hypothetical protein PKC21_01740 [Oligoflexia bacterium]|nr:hypothetical protein [Oligoflexia bacterium]HMR24053.1 hypothetical protein [Oligoflexia bacterium]